MAITEYEQLSFRLHAISFFYLWPAPLIWDFENSKLVRNKKPIWLMLPYIFMLLLIVFMACSCLWSAFWMLLIGPQDELKILHLAVWISVWALCTVFCASLCLAYPNRNAILFSFNELLSSADELTKQYPECKSCSLKNKSEKDFLGVFFAFLVMPTASIMAYAISLAAFVTNMDCFYYIQEHILGDPKYRSYEMILFALVIRMGLLTLADLELIRSMGFALSCGMVALRTTFDVAKTMLVRIRDLNVIYTYYIHICLIVKKVEKDVNLWIYMAMSLSFWGLVFCCFSFFKYEAEEIDISVYACIGVCTCLLIMGHAIILPLFCRVSDVSKLVVKYHTLRAKLLVSKWRITKRYTILRRMQSVQPYQVRYGPFWYLDRNFLPEYFELLVERVFDVMLIE